MLKRSTFVALSVFLVQMASGNTSMIIHAYIVNCWFSCCSKSTLIQNLKSEIIKLLDETTINVPLIHWVALLPPSGHHCPNPMRNGVNYPHLWIRNFIHGAVEISCNPCLPFQHSLFRFLLHHCCPDLAEQSKLRPGTT